MQYYRDSLENDAMTGTWLTKFGVVSRFGDAAEFLLFFLEANKKHTPTCLGNDKIGDNDILILVCWTRLAYLNARATSLRVFDRTTIVPSRQSTASGPELQSSAELVNYTSGSQVT